MNSREIFIIVGTYVVKYLNNPKGEVRIFFKKIYLPTLVLVNSKHSQILHSLEDKR